MARFFEIYEHIQEQTDNLNNHICMRQIGFENLPTKKIPGPHVLLANSIKYLGKKYQSYLRSFKKQRQKEHLFDENNNALIVPGQTLQKIRQLQITSLHEQRYTFP